MPTSDEQAARDEQALKRLAMGVFLQLPENLDDAAEVLARCAEILKWHQGIPYQWAEPLQCADQPSDVVPFTRRG